MDHAEARAIAQSYIEGPELRRPERDVVLVDRLTIEHERYFVFFYNTAEFVRTGSILHALAGNGPLVVDRRTGKLTVLPTTATVADSLKAYEATLTD